MSLFGLLGGGDAYGNSHISGFYGYGINEYYRSQQNAALGSGGLSWDEIQELRALIADKIKAKRQLYVEAAIRHQRAEWEETKKHLPQRFEDFKRRLADAQKQLLRS